MISRHAIRLASLCAVIAVLAAGCGGGTPRLSDAQFRFDANGICDQLYHEQKSNQNDASKAATDLTISRIDAALGRLAALHPPKTVEAKYQQLLAEIKAAVTFIKTNEAQFVYYATKMQSHPTYALGQKFAKFAAPAEQELKTAGTEATALLLPTCARDFAGPTS